jgi:hypothetical protein
VAAGPPAAVAGAREETVGDRAGAGCARAGVERGVDGAEAGGAGADGGCTAGAWSGALGARGPVTLCAVPLTPLTTCPTICT